MGGGSQPCNSIFHLGSRIAAMALSVVVMFVLTNQSSRPAQAQTYRVLYRFTGGLDGGNPYAGLTMDGAGNFYGTTYAGGSAHLGTVYQLKRKHSAWVINPLHSFAGYPTDGAYPEGRVVFGPNGTLYGNTFAGGNTPACNPGYGCGTIFNLRPPPTACVSAICPWTASLIYAFGGTANDGAFPIGDFIFDHAGNMYGSTGGGGDNDRGTVFELSPAGAETVLYRFPQSGAQGQNPEGGVIFDAAGNLYGTANSSSLMDNYGVVFELNYAAGWTESTLYTFLAGNDGGYPQAGLVSDAAGNFYGATSQYGMYGGGTVFKLTPSGSGWTLSTIYSFTGQCGPERNLAIDAAGNLYGTTFCDGANSAGNVFKLTPSGDGWTYTSLYDFTGGSDGGFPFSNVIFDASGNLYGTTYAGGTTSGHCDSFYNYHCGVVWQIMP
jgi:uncharacterized repeat protein (TIGR03803 family)